MMDDQARTDLLEAFYRAWCAWRRDPFWCTEQRVVELAERLGTTEAGIDKDAA